MKIVAIIAVVLGSGCAGLTQSGSGYISIHESGKVRSERVSFAPGDTVTIRHEKGIHIQKVPPSFYAP